MGGSSIRTQAPVKSATQADPETQQALAEAARRRSRAKGYQNTIMRRFSAEDADTQQRLQTLGS